MKGSLHDWRQHYPTYRFSNRDIALKEYETAARSIESDERIFLNAAHVTLIVGVGLVSLAIGTFDRIAEQVAPILSPAAVSYTAISLVILFSIVVLRYFADRQKAVAFATRKLIVLRRMLGVSYGPLHLVLPRWRIEGAEQPFAIKLFPGWTSYVAYPFWIVIGFSTPLIVLLILHAHAHAGGVLSPSWVIALAAAWVLIGGIVYRSALFDTHERIGLLLSIIAARVLRLGLVADFEEVLYRATLARYETERLRIDLEPVKALAIFLEDREFDSHSGVSIRGLARAVLGIMGKRSRSGASTITQQLVRTLFIAEPTKLVRRKLIEIGMALWLETVLAKRDLLELYLSSVRYERGVFGLPAAMRHFFGGLLQRTTMAQAFVLVERVSNIRGKVLGSKVRAKLQQAVAAGLLNNVDVREAVAIYADLIRRGLLVEEAPGTVQRLAEQLLERP